MTKPMLKLTRSSDHEGGNEKYATKLEILITQHAAYFDHLPWPKPNTEEWADLVKSWIDAFGEQKYSPRKVERAMAAIRKAPPNFKTEHLPKLLELIAEADDNYAQPEGDPEKPDGPPCELCSGQGYTRAYRRDYKGVERIVQLDAEDLIRKRTYLQITAPCICDRGRRILSILRATKVPCVDLANLPNGWGLIDPTGSSPEARAFASGLVAVAAY